MRIKKITTTDKRELFGIVGALIKRGVAYIEPGANGLGTNEVTGIAADGTHVSLGQLDSPATLAYLKSNPNPENW